MNKLLIALCLTVAASSMAYAKDEKAPTAQQERMASCNKQAAEKGLKGADRKQFMSQCLKGESEAVAASKKALTPQQQRMSDCNKEAKEKSLKGADRKKFMSECLKKK
jgi:hypothetical protein